MSRSVPRRGGFTLFEVLAAAVIMAAIYSVLSAANIDGAILEGDAKRRLEASLVADRYLADLETAIALGVPPELGTREEREGLYSVRVDVAPLELPFEQWLPEPETSRAPRRDARGPSLLAPAGRGGPVPLLQIQVIVAWSDGVRDNDVRRTTFLLDANLAAGLLQQAGIGEAIAGATQSGGPEDEDAP